MKFAPSTYADIRKYFDSTYAKFAELGEKLLYIKQIKQDSITATDSAGDVYELVLEEAAPYEMTYTLPHRALFAHKGRAYMLQRIPARQYQRGINTANTQIISVPDGKKQSLSWELLDAFTNKQDYQTLAEAVFGKFNKEIIAVPLSCRSMFDRRLQAIFFDRQQVANVSRDGKKIQTVSLFKEEVEEMMTDTRFAEFTLEVLK
jgi:hypothetical protein